MSQSGRIGLALTQWLVIPLLLGVIGYFVLGPRLGNSAVAKKARALDLPFHAPEEDTPEVQPVAPVKRDGLEVVSRPEGDRTFRPPRLEVSTKPKSERRARPKQETVEKPKPERAPAKDSELDPANGSGEGEKQEEALGPVLPKRMQGGSGTATEPQGDGIESSIESAIIQPTTAPM